MPKILAWSADPENPVGAEYIIMQKAPGVRLFEAWDEIPEAGRLKLIKQLTELESQLAAIPFPAYGSLYFRRSIPEDSKRILLDLQHDPEAIYCVGPACGPEWTDGASSNDLQSDLDVGPCQ